MNQFDIYENPISKGCKTYPFVCCLQNNLFDELSTRVISFITRDESIAFDGLSACIKIDGDTLFICMNVIATIETHRLTNLAGSASGYRDAIIDAYDKVFTGI